MAMEMARDHVQSRRTSTLSNWVLAAMVIITTMQPVCAQYDGVALTQSNMQALLAFKAALEDPNQAMASWDETTAQAGACAGSWGGIKCAQGEVIVLQLPGKGLGGTISAQVGRLTQLRKLNLHTNIIIGPIPTSLALLSNLRAIILFENRLSGVIPGGLGSSPVLQALDLSRNQLGGAIPAGLAASSKLLFVDLSYNNLSGSLPGDLATNPTLALLNVSHNQLNGALPVDWGGSKELRYFDASSNVLSGSLPPSLCKLTALQLLDLSENRFSGSLPDTLSLLVDLTSFNISYNLLSGAIPAFRHGFSESSFAGNAGLCGLHTFFPCIAPGSPASPQPKSQPRVERIGHGVTTAALILIILGCASVFSCIIVILLAIIWRTSQDAELEAKKVDRNEIAEETTGKFLHFEPLEEGSFTAEDLLSATAEVMGKSSLGTVYKATLQSGSTVVVKRLKEEILKDQTELEAEVKLLGRIKHPNLVRMRACYWGCKAEKLLVFDFISEGSLAAFLHVRGPEIQFCWTARMNVAAEAAEGLNYLHVQANLAHGNLSSSNILLDSTMTAKISDFGQARLITSSARSALFACTSGRAYRAPELTKLKKATPKSDVYSFGIVLLELLTGKPPGESIPIENGAIHLRNRVSLITEKEWKAEVLDVELMKGSSPPSQDQMLEILQLAMHCCASSPNLRPQMVDVMHKLKEVCEVSQTHLQ